MKILCPVCHEPLRINDHAAVCRNHHSFDLARSGYLNLYRSNRKGHGDNKEMVQARTAFLESGAYAFLRDELVEISAGMPHDHVLDLACGEGYYTRALPGTEKIGIDLSKDALKHAAGRDPETAYVLASIFDVPVSSESTDVILTCFAPLAAQEITRLLKPGGHFIFVSPGPYHLYEMKKVLYEHPYLNEVKDIDHFLPLMDEKTITASFTPDHETLAALFHMTPYAYKTGEEGMKRLAETEELTITAEFLIRIYEKTI
jgi:23S rRNA (guanine745-N1)-methyltransferase